MVSVAVASLASSRNPSYTSLCSLKEMQKAAVVHHCQYAHGVGPLGGGMRKIASAPNLVAKAARFTAGPSALQQTSYATTDAEQASFRVKQRQQQQQHSQQHMERTTAVEASVAEVSTSASRPQQLRNPVLADNRFATLSRVLLVGQPGTMFRNLANRKWPSAIGPISLLVFLFGTVMALFAAVRGALVRKVKSCKCCKGFGVVRCRLCDGRGTVDWSAKFSYSESCPLCAAKRFVVCPECGGHYHRRLFNHARGSKGLDAYFPSGGAATSAPAGGAAAAAVSGAGAMSQRTTALD